MLISIGRFCVETEKNWTVLCKCCDERHMSHDMANVTAWSPWLTVRVFSPILCRLHNDAVQFCCYYIRLVRQKWAFLKRSIEDLTHILDTVDKYTQPYIFHFPGKLGLISWPFVSISSSTDIPTFRPSCLSSFLSLHCHISLNLISSFFMFSISEQSFVCRS